MGTELERWLLVGPPFHGDAMWAPVVARWAADTVRVVDVLSHGDEIASAAASIASDMRGRQVVLVAHGLALPVAWRAARDGGASALVITNGPLTSLHPITRSLVRLLDVAPWALRPRVAVPALSSSLAFRRLVVNPYVMERDMVVALLGPVLQTSAGRMRVRRYLRAAVDSFDEHPSFEGPTLAIWGDDDVLHPASIADEARRWFPRYRHIAIPGGRLFHPIERPWSLADGVDAWLRESMTAT